MRWSWLPLLKWLPKNLISRIFGCVARWRIPFFAPWFRNWFAHHFDIDLSDASRPLEQYPTAYDLFVRELKPDARLIARSAVVSPVDGKLSQSGFLDDEPPTLIQAKGKNYTLAELVRNSQLAERFRGGAYAVIYLAPFNYHRIHCPCDGYLKAVYYCPGTLWPVNEESVRRVDGLFGVNERLTSHLQLVGGGEMLVVKVGATNVGRISLAVAPGWVTNTRRAPSRRFPLTTWYPEQLIQVQRGDLLGIFELGSTVILVVDAETRRRYPLLFQELAGKPLRMGQALCSDSM